MILVISLASVGSGLFIYAHLFVCGTFTEEQCELVERNFDKLKVGMIRKEVFPLIGGERKVSVTYPPGEFLREKAGASLSEQTNPW